MPDRIPGINRVTANLAGGQQAIYYYHRATGTKLPGEYGSPEFLEALAAARAAKPTRDAGTLAGLIRDFQATAKWRKLAESTKSEYRRVFKFWEDKFGKIETKGLASRLFRASVLKWHDAYSADHPREADNRVTILARVLAWAKADRDLAANVLEGFDRAYAGDRSEIIWLPEHVTKFMEHAGEEMQIAMMLALHTGQRQADIRKMAWGNYDGTALRIRVGKTARNGKEAKLVTIPCTAALKVMLDSLPRKGALIMPTKTGRAFTKRYLNEHWTTTMVAAGLDPKALHFHDLRGTTVTLLAEGGAEIGEIVAITGHTIGTAQRILDRYLARTGYLASAAIIKLENRMEQERAKWPAKWQGSTSAK